ncbi:hypothetical protein F441_18173 [Phytophthora nicotianae CJ01A1]|uniref:CCHC-type domain-containing protein n=1 Tax=Phytophthora nicotianae CJ01A1 TaxID=1317063 RepID=W2W6G7_PHYNI|nr:hypothetical protein F441_18173 [Phytophthora nicotianae CJ01A1]
MVVIQGLSRRNEESVHGDNEDEKSPEVQEGSQSNNYAGLQKSRGMKMVAATMVATVSKKAQKARRVRKPGEESSPSSTDSESRRPVTRSQGAKKVLTSVTKRMRVEQRQVAEPATDQAEEKLMKVKRTASERQQRSTSKGKDAKEVKQSQSTTGNDKNTAMRRKLTRAVAELQASSKATHGVDGERRPKRARGGSQRRVQRVRRASKVDGVVEEAQDAEHDEHNDDEAPRGDELVTSAATSDCVAPDNHADLEAMASAIQKLTTVVARLQPAPARGQRYNVGRRVVRRSESRKEGMRSSGNEDNSSSGQSISDDDDSDDDPSDEIGDPDDDNGSGGESSEPSRSSSASSDESTESNDRRGRRERRRRRHEQRVRRERHERRGRHARNVQHEERRRQPRRKSVKDLELPTFTPSPKVSVSTWIDRVDLALKGAAESGRGEWPDHALYFILGNKLMDNAARWWVNMNRRLPSRDRTWTYLKKALLRRYGEKLDKSAAEWRVNMSRMMPGETYSDFAAALRDVVGRNKVSERVILAQFYRNLDKTTKKLVKQRPKPKTLEDAVDKANEIDDPMDNVAQGMQNIGQPWATAPSPYLVPVDGTTGQTLVIPGIGGTGLPTELKMASVGGATAAEAEHGTLALFTNPQGVWNEYSGTWDVPAGRVWNGKFWYEPRKASRKRSTEGAVRSRRCDESDVKPQRKKQKAAVRQVAEPRQEQRSGGSQPPGRSRAAQDMQACWKCGKNGHWAAQCPTGPKCYACNQYGHMAKDCTDAEAKAKNEENLRKRKTEVKVSGNAKPAQ